VRKPERLTAGIPNAVPMQHPPERRHSVRFPIEQEIYCRALSKRRRNVIGSGRTLNISSCGVLFTSDRNFRWGERLELSISWPVRLENKLPLKLVAKGRVVRLEPGRAAIRIEAYEFQLTGVPARG
jgi:hypothetical protein